MNGDDPHYLGHRERLRGRFVDAGTALPDYELMELVLFRSIPRRDVKALAKELVAHFGSFAEVISAPLEKLQAFDGIGQSTAIDLKIVAESGRRQAKGQIRDLTTVASWTALQDYCRVAMAFAEREELRILFLNKKNQILADEVQQVGTIDHTPVYPREVVRRAISLSATALIIVHNHPTWPFLITMDHAQAS